MSIKSDVQTLALGNLCEFFILDNTNVGGSLIVHFHPGVAVSASTTWNDVVWSSPQAPSTVPVPQLYSRWPIDASGFEWAGKGVNPQPKIQVANILGLMSGVNYTHHDLVGAKVTRKRTLMKYLDAVNFPGGVNPLADPYASFGDDIYYVNRKSVENPVYCEYELASPWDVAGKMLPGRQVIQNCCPWKYRGDECSYTGGPVADTHDQAVTDPLLDVCGKRLSSCKLRFGANNPLPYGGFPSAGLMRP